MKFSYSAVSFVALAIRLASQSATTAFQPRQTTPTAASAGAKTSTTPLEFQPKTSSSNPRGSAKIPLEFQIHDHEYEKDGSRTTVFEVPVRQEGVKMYIANDGDLQSSRPGNGGMRLLSYESEQHAIEDAV
ncbi:MAG: hypothetical protein SGARI_006535, partial [Bacillariaceae sp.]